MSASIFNPAAPPADSMPNMIEDHFLSWALSEGGVRAEWVNGEVLLMSPASSRHVLLVGWLHRCFGQYIEDHELGVLVGPELMIRIAHAGRSVRVPDLMFIPTSKLPQIKTNHLEGPPDLAIEIVSPDSMVRDRHDKLTEYELAGVAEYWIIDPDGQTLEAYVRNAQGRFDKSEPTPHGIIHAATITGFWLRLDWLWQPNLPSASACLRELERNR